MTDSAANKERHVRRLIAAVAGLMLALAFPKAEIAGLAWLAPGLLVFSAFGVERRFAFQIGWIGGMTFCLTALYWLNHMPVTGLPVLAWLALSAYVAAYFGLWVVVCNRLSEFCFGSDSGVSIGDAFARIANTGWLRRFQWMVFCGVSWTGLEFICGRILTGFPWLQLGVTQFKLLPLIQIAAITGIPGLTFLLVWFSVALMSAMLLLAGRPGNRSLAWLEIVMPLLIVSVVFAWGTQRMRHANQVVSPAEKRVLKMALIQPGFPQTLIWDSQENTNRFNKLFKLSRTALAAKPDILVWPEAAVPGLLMYDPQVSRPIIELARKHRVWILCGCDDARFPDGVGEGRKPDYFNSAFLINPNGELIRQYDKRRLVIFGEYVPLAKWLPFLKWLTPIEGGFESGKEAVQFPMPELKVQASVLICFEDIFAWLGREAAQPETDFLVNLTNDGWFGESAQHWQHLVLALFRSIETGRPLVRCTNNGITCWVDPLGRVHGVTENRSRSVHAEGFKVIDVPLPPRNSLREPTFFHKHGDWFAWLCLVSAVGLFFINRLKPAGSLLHPDPVGTP